MQLADLGRRSVVIFGTNILGALSGFAAAVAMARFMQPEAVGMFAGAFAAMAIAAIFTDVGLDVTHVKRVSEGVDLGTAIATYGRMKRFLVAVVMTTAFLVALAWDRLIGFHDSFTLATILSVLGFFLFQELRKVYERTFAARQETAKSQVLNIVEFAIKAPAVVLVALIWGHLNGKWVPVSFIPEAIADLFGLDGPWSLELGAILIGLSWSLSMLTSYVVALFMFRGHAYPRGRYDPALARRYRQFALPVALFVVLTVVAMRIDSLMLIYFWSSFEAGIHYQITRIITVVLIVPTAVRQLFLPFMSEFHGKGDHDTVREVAVTAQRLISLAMVLGLTLILVFPDEIIHIALSDSYLLGAHALMALAGWTFVMAIGSISQSAVMGFDKPRWVLIAGLTNVLTNITLNLIFIPSSLLGIPMLGLKVTGAALATLLAQTMHFIVVTYMAKRLTGQAYVTPAIIRHGAAAVATAGILLWAKTWDLFGGVDRFYELGAICVFGSLLYFLILMTIREVGRSDWLLIRDMVSPAKMRKYVREELGGRGRP